MAEKRGMASLGSRFVVEGIFAYEAARRLGPKAEQDMREAERSILVGLMLQQPKLFDSKQTTGLVEGKKRHS